MPVLTHAREGVTAGIRCDCLAPALAPTRLSDSSAELQRQRLPDPPRPLSLMGMGKAREILSFLLGHFFRISAS